MKIWSFIKRNKKHIICYPLVALFFLILGLFWYPLSEEAYKSDFLNIHIDNKDYELSVSFKHPEEFNILYKGMVQSRVRDDLDETIIFFKSPSHIQEKLLEINLRSTYEKLKLFEILKDYLQDFLDRQKQKRETEA